MKFAFIAKHRTIWPVAWLWMHLACPGRASIWPNRSRDPATNAIGKPNSTTRALSTRGF